MKKILLIGERNDVIKDLGKNLSSYFDLQHSLGDEDSVAEAILDSEPDLIILSTVATYQVKQGLLRLVEERCPGKPLLLICSTQRDYVEYCPRLNHDRLLPPVNRTQILGKCAELLHMDKLEKHTDSSSERSNILIVDDCAMILRSMKVELEKEYDVRIAPSGKKALELMRSDIPDLVLLDYEMDGMSGREVFETMLADVELKDVPVVFLTSVTEKKKIYDVLASRPAGYILKPPDYERIRETIEDVLLQRAGI